MKEDDTEGKLKGRDVKQLEIERITVDFTDEGKIKRILQEKLTEKRE